MWWIIGSAIVVMVVVAIVVSMKKEAAREEERRRRKQRYLDDIRRALKPGIRFKAYGSSGNTIKGEVINVLDSNTIEAWCRSDMAPSVERGRFPIDRIYEVWGIEPNKRIRREVGASVRHTSSLRDVMSFGADVRSRGESCPSRRLKSDDTHTLQPQSEDAEDE